MKPDLEASYAYCQHSARRSASSFYYSFWLLSRRKRRAMCALYAFLRHTDDLGDSGAAVDQRRAALAGWRQSLERATRAQFDHPLLPALAHTLCEFRIPREHLEAVIDGVEMDLVPRVYDTFADLEAYCYRVASVVGLACLHIWNCDRREAQWPARQCGLAFQMTNILRDLAEDAAAGRIYLPREDLERFGYTADDLRRGVRDERFRRLMHFEIARTESLYAEAAALDIWLSAESRRVLGSMVAVYRALLDEIKRLEGEVLSRRATVSRWRRLRIAARHLIVPPSMTSAVGAATP